MAHWFASLLVAVVLLKPQEFVPVLHEVPLVHVAFGLTLLALAAGGVLGEIRLALAPQVPFVVGFLLWALLTTALKEPSAVAAEAASFAILLGLFLAVGLACSSVSGLRVLFATFVAIAVVVAAVGAVQIENAYGCFLAATDDWEGRGELTRDGRPCEVAADCRRDAPVVDGNYRCERPGPLGTATIGGRVRYRGSLADPNELALAISVVLPYAFVLANPSVDRRPSTPSKGSGRRRVLVRLPPQLRDGFLQGVAHLARSLPALGLVLLVGYVVILTRSRSGALVLAVVLGLDTIRRMGVWGVVGGCALAPIVLILGGRSGSEADDSSIERMEILREAFEFIRRTRGVGLGAGRFMDESSLGLTAHNAYVLAAAETGIVGVVAFSLALYSSMKTLCVVWASRERIPAELRQIAAALAVSLCGMFVGLAFLSWTYKDMLYMTLGASMGVYCAAKHRDGALRIVVSVREAALVSALTLALLGVVYVGSRIQRG